MSAIRVLPGCLMERRKNNGTTQGSRAQGDAIFLRDLASYCGQVWLIYKHLVIKDHSHGLWWCYYLLSHTMLFLFFYAIFIAVTLLNFLKICGGSACPLLFFNNPLDQFKILLTILNFYLSDLFFITRLFSWIFTEFNNIFLLIWKGFYFHDFF